MAGVECEGRAAQQQRDYERALEGAEAAARHAVDKAEPCESNAAANDAAGDRHDEQGAEAEACYRERVYCRGWQGVADAGSEGLRRRIAEGPDGEARRGEAREGEGLADEPQPEAAARGDRKDRKNRDIDAGQSAPPVFRRYTAASCRPKRSSSAPGITAW